jgi:hypothetical protein
MDILSLETLLILESLCGILWASYPYLPHHSELLLSSGLAQGRDHRSRDDRVLD